MAKRTDTSMTIRMNKEVKRAAQDIFSALGMDMTTAINVFLRQAIIAKGFPFPVRLNKPNAKTIAAFEEGKRRLHDRSESRFPNVEDLFSDLDAQ